jgi:hypothetical protein
MKCSLESRSSHDSRSKRPAKTREIYMEVQLRKERWTIIHPSAIELEVEKAEENEKGARSLAAVIP